MGGVHITCIEKSSVTFAYNVWYISINVHETLTTHTYMWIIGVNFKVEMILNLGVDKSR